MMAVAVSSHAASITLESINSGVYQYQLALAPGDEVVFTADSQINFTGLVGVTAVSPIDAGFTSCGFTGTSACFAEIFVSQTFSNPCTVNRVRSIHHNLNGGLSWAGRLLGASDAAFL